VTITKLEQQKRNASRFNLYIDNQFLAGISSNTLTKFNLYRGKELDEKSLEQILYHELKQRFLDRAINYLVRAPKTTFQLKRYLGDLQYKKKDDWYDEDASIDFEKIFDEIIEHLEEMKLLDDEKYAHLFVESRIKNRPRGKFVLVSELISKGVDKEIAKKVCDELIEDEYDILKKTYYKRYKDEKLDMKDRKKISYLQRKGFSYDLIKKFANSEFTE
jgi:regulatory protein